MVLVYKAQSQVEQTYEEDGGAMTCLMVLQAHQHMQLKMTEAH